LLLWLNGSSTVAAANASAMTPDSSSCSPCISLTIFPQSWLGTLLYSYAMDGNGHVIIRRHGHIREQYDQGDIEYVSLCLYGRHAGIRPGSQCCSNFIRKDASVSTHIF
jgi:hypothetical protein